MSTLRYTCPCCGQEHEGLPDLAHSWPDCWDAAAAAREPHRNRLDSDTCVVDGEHFFIRCVLRAPIRGADAALGWGVRLSQSGANFRAYIESFGASLERETFGYFSNRLPSHPDTMGLRALARWRGDRQRPLVGLEPVEHPLARDWRDGIPQERAVEFAVPVLHREAAERSSPRAH